MMFVFFCVVGGFAFKHPPNFAELAVFDHASFFLRLVQIGKKVSQNSGLPI